MGNSQFKYKKLQEEKDVKDKMKQKVKFRLFFMFSKLKLLFYYRRKNMIMKLKRLCTLAVASVFVVFKIYMFFCLNNNYWFIKYIIKY